MSRIFAEHEREGRWLEVRGGTTASSSWLKEKRAYRHEQGQDFVGAVALFGSGRS